MRTDQPAGTSASFDTAVPAGTQYEEEHLGRPISFRHRLRRMFWHILARQFTLLSVAALHSARLIGRKSRPVPSGGCEIMLTGRFDSDNWIRAHVGPLAASKECSRLWMVSASPVPQLPKVNAIYPPRWLMKIVGVTPARLLTFLWEAMRRHPHVVGGFGLTVNGIPVIITGRLTGARSMYFCVGGPAEVRDGGVHSAENLFAKMETDDAIVERRFLRMVAEADAVIAMGSGAVTFFRDKGVDTGFHVVSGGIDSRRFQSDGDAPSHDLVLTGRLVEIKRIDVFLRAIKHVAERIPDVSAVIVGNGRLLDKLREMAVDLGIDSHVDFVGHQESVETWLRRSRVFVLTSDSEGLSLSTMEAMMCGLPAVVSDVGDLGDLVEDGVNGFLVPRRAPELFADRLVELLSDEPKLRSFSQAARRAALRYETQATIKHWDRILADLWVFRSQAHSCRDEQ